jgi:hypothetical protein
MAVARWAHIQRRRRELTVLGSPVPARVPAAEGQRLRHDVRGRDEARRIGSPIHYERTDLAVHRCRDHSLLRVGPTVRDFTRAMQQQHVGKVSTPRTVTIDGNNGTYFEIELPAWVDPGPAVTTPAANSTWTLCPRWPSSSFPGLESITPFSGRSSGRYSTRRITRGDPFEVEARVSSRQPRAPATCSAVMAAELRTSQFAARNVGPLVDVRCPGKRS